MYDFKGKLKRLEKAYIIQRGKVVMVIDRNADGTFNLNGQRVGMGQLEAYAKVKGVQTLIIDDI